VGQSYGFVTDRGTVPFPFTMTGETVEQLLNGPKISVNAPADTGARTSQPAPISKRISDAELDAFIDNANELDRIQSGTVGALSAGAP
jgi:hypothetical protein